MLKWKCNASNVKGLRESSVRIRDYECGYLHSVPLYAVTGPPRAGRIQETDTLLKLEQISNITPDYDELILAFGMECEMTCCSPQFR